MMNPSNLCIFEGRVSRDPQISQVQMGLDQNGQPNMVDKALFSIAVDRALSTQDDTSAQYRRLRRGYIALAKDYII